MSSSFYYMATPYSKFDAGFEEAYRLACMAAADCLREGILVFSPIAHGHGIAMHGGLGNGYGAWERFNKAMMSAAAGLIVVKLDGWRDSAGIAAEVRWFKKRHKPVVFRDPPAERCRG